MSDSVITRNKAKAMVQKYRTAPAGGVNPNTGQTQDLTQFVHFTFAQFFELLAMNSIASGSDTVQTILQNKSNFGIKVYFAQHADSSDCPNNDSNYIGRNTVVLANTVKVNGIWYDMPDTDNTTVAIQQFVTANSGHNADRGEMCPPTCTNFSNNL